ncbi:hypothetical protein Q9S78_12120 [Microbacterium sp. KSW-18]|uniref:Uncharacterized protein n=1 Tax=Microbacterium aquilitoris TaxID=3067307 RepID=A0ABU3GLY8_9MICO|nr:hypothetical protein [Microbacterium sp. KSW-18]MDT3331415.1 hypothetical protein [Microbacterium sp. KSW-18]
MGKHLDQVTKLHEHSKEEVEDSVALWAAIRYIAEHLDTTEAAKEKADAAQARQKSWEGAQIAGINL